MIRPLKPTIVKHDPTTEYFFDENCFITELSNSDNDPALSIARARVAPGEATEWHRLDGVTERYVILEGNGRVEVGDLAPQAVSTGDVVVIPPMQRQRISNTGSDNLVFLAICTPRFKPSSYQAVGTPE